MSKSITQSRLTFYISTVCSCLQIFISNVHAIQLVYNILYLSFMHSQTQVLITAQVPEEAHR